MEFEKEKNVMEEIQGWLYLINGWKSRVTKCGDLVIYVDYEPGFSYEIEEKLQKILEHFSYELNVDFEYSLLKNKIKVFTFIY